MWAVLVGDLMLLLWLLLRLRLGWRMGSGLGLRRRLPVAARYMA
jgi:hypothetical protein